MGHANIIVNLVGINIKFAEQMVYFFSYFEDKYLEDEMTFGSVLFNNFTTVQSLTHEQTCLWSKKTIKVTLCVFLLHSPSRNKG